MSGLGMLRSVVLASLLNWSALDIGIVAVLAAVLITLLLWPRRRLTPRALDAVVRAAYTGSFAGVGCEIVEMSPLQIDAELFQLVMLIAPTAPGDRASIDEIGATATLVGLDAMDRWPGLTSFETRLACAAAGVPSTQLVVLTRGHRSRADAHDRPCRPPR